MHESNSKPDPRLTPSYTVAEAAHYLRLPSATVRSWVQGQTDPIRGARKRSSPVLLLPNRRNPQLSFLNLVEAHVLSALRRQHGLSLQNIRRAVNYLGRTFESKHPLAEYSFVTDGVDLLFRRSGALLNASREGQVEMERVIAAHLRRIDRDRVGMPIRLFPFTYMQDLDQPRAVVIDPGVSFGRPVLSGTGIPTATIAQRYKAGESVAALAEDYDRSLHTSIDLLRVRGTRFGLPKRDAKGGSSSARMIESATDNWRRTPCWNTGFGLLS
jgi:uncharacterized protein (DUF433 family)